MTCHGDNIYSVFQNGNVFLRKLLTVVKQKKDTVLLSACIRATHTHANPRYHILDTAVSSSSVANRNCHLSQICVAYLIDPSASLLVGAHGCTHARSMHLLFPGLYVCTQHSLHTQGAPGHSSLSVFLLGSRCCNPVIILWKFEARLCLYALGGLTYFTLPSAAHRGLTCRFSVN